MVTLVSPDLGIEASMPVRWISQELEGILDVDTNHHIRWEAATEVERQQCKLRRRTIEPAFPKRNARLLCQAPALTAFVPPV